MIKRGTQVRAQHDGQWYPATYVAERASGDHRIVWQDGGKVAEVSAVEELSIAKASVHQMMTHHINGFKESWEKMNAAPENSAEAHAHAEKARSHLRSINAQTSYAHQLLDWNGPDASTKPQPTIRPKGKAFPKRRVGE